MINVDRNVDKKTALFQHDITVLPSAASSDIPQGLQVSSLRDLQVINNTFGRTKTSQICQN